MPARMVFTLPVRAGGGSLRRKPCGVSEAAGAAAPAAFPAAPAAAAAATALAPAKAPAGRTKTASTSRFDPLPIPTDAIIIKLERPERLTISPDGTLLLVVAAEGACLFDISRRE